MGRSALARAGLGALLGLGLLASTGPTFGVMPMPEPIEQPLPKELQQPFAHFLRLLGSNNPERILDSAKSTKIAGVLADTLVVRLEDRATCNNNVCLTIIGRLEKGTFIAQTMFMAGGMLTRGDVFAPIFDRPVAPPLWFCPTQNCFHDPGVVFVWETPGGWVVAPALK